MIDAPKPASRPESDAVRDALDHIMRVAGMRSRRPMSDPSRTRWRAQTENGVIFR